MEKYCLLLLIASSSLFAAASERRSRQCLRWAQELTDTEGIGYTDITMEENGTIRVTTLEKFPLLRIHEESFYVPNGDGTYRVTTTTVEIPDGKMARTTHRESTSAKRPMTREEFRVRALYLRELMKNATEKYGLDAADLARAEQRLGQIAAFSDLPLWEQRELIYVYACARSQKAMDCISRWAASSGYSPSLVRSHFEGTLRSADTLFDADQYVYWETVDVVSKLRKKGFIEQANEITEAAIKKILKPSP